MPRRLGEVGAGQAQQLEPGAGGQGRQQKRQAGLARRYADGEPAQADVAAHVLRHLRQRDGAEAEVA